MLREIENPRQIPGEGRRRWFRDDFFDLIIWYADSGDVEGFQLCYDRNGAERAFTWRTTGETEHSRIDDGEIPGHTKRSPILVEDGAFDRQGIAERFKSESRNIDREIAEMVNAAILDRS